MSNLVLVRHSLPEIDPAVPADQWRLSEKGRHLAETLADRLACYEPSAIMTSPEPKAVETAEIVAGRTGTPVELADGLREHDRRNEAFLGSQAEFEERMALLFENPGRLVFGQETADEAFSRFSQAVFEMIDRHPEDDTVMVTHGTVMTLFLSQAVGLAPLPFWRGLGMPSFAVMSVPSMDLIRVVQNVEAEGCA